MPDTPISAFADLNLPSSVLKALKELGYETPSPIQAATIPLLLAGRDVLACASTGSIAPADSRQQARAVRIFIIGVPRSCE